MDTQEQLITAIKEIGAWSKENFGDQEGDGLKLGRIAPFLGIIEEVGELSRSSDYGDLKDAAGDMMIFLTDYLMRTGWPAEEIAKIYSNACRPLALPNLQSVVLTLAELCHTELKRVQGIRGMDDPETYAIRQRGNVAYLVSWLHTNFSRWGSQDTPLTVLVEVWQRVRQRNWKVNKLNGMVAANPEEATAESQPQG